MGLGPSETQSNRISLLCGKEKQFDFNNFPHNKRLLVLWLLTTQTTIASSTEVILQAAQIEKWKKSSSDSDYIH